MPPERETNDDDDDAERDAFLKIARAVFAYDRDVDALIARWNASLWAESLSDAKYEPILREARTRVLKDAPACAEANVMFLRSVIGTFVDNERVPAHVRIPGEAVESWRADETFRATREDAEKVRYVLKNAYRDWSAEGLYERTPVYEAIFNALAEALPVDVDVGSPDGEAPRVLVPGCGLGRLVFELAKRGYDAQGNEFSYFMLLFSSFMLNATSVVREFRIHPWMHGRSNHRRAADQWRECAIPDEVPGNAKLPPGAAMSMVAGDFVEVYGSPREKGAWDAVVTCFFIDTGHDVVKYLEVVANCLRSGGVWINFGPLLYHWEDYAHEQSVELSMDEVLDVAKLFGLDVQTCEYRDVDYTSDERSMHRTTYSCAHVVATKRK